MIYIVFNKKHKSYIYPLKHKYKNVNFVLGGENRQKSSLKVLSLVNKKKYINIF